MIYIRRSVNKATAIEALRRLRSIEAVFCFCGKLEL